MKARAIISAIRTQTFRELVDRGRVFLEYKFDRGHKGAKYALTPENEIFAGLGLPADLLHEAPLIKIERHIRRRQATAALPPSGICPDANLALARFCYACCRRHRPQIVVETGVGNGVTTSFILTALAVNGKGRLISIDRPPLGLASGAFVPDNLKERWEPRPGDSRRLLPELLRETGTIDLFLHDGLHTYPNMLFEYAAAWDKLKPNGILISDDVAMNRAFQDFTSRVNPAYAAVHESALFAVAAKKQSVSFTISREPCK